MAANVNGLILETDTTNMAKNGGGPFFLNNEDI
jgi:hypothetical protein